MQRSNDHHNTVKLSYQKSEDHYLIVQFPQEIDADVVGQLVQALRDKNIGKGQLEIIDVDDHTIYITLNMKPNRVKEAQGYSFNETVYLVYKVLNDKGLNVSLDESYKVFVNNHTNNVTIDGIIKMSDKSLDNILELDLDSIKADKIKTGEGYTDKQINTVSVILHYIKEKLLALKDQLKEGSQNFDDRIMYIDNFIREISNEFDNFRKDEDDAYIIDFTLDQSFLLGNVYSIALCYALNGDEKNNIPSLTKLVDGSYIAMKNEDAKEKKSKNKEKMHASDSRMFSESPSKPKPAPGGINLAGSADSLINVVKGFISGRKNK